MQRGFTLVEILVALVIMGVLTTAGYRSLDSALQARERIAAETRKWQNLSLFFSRLEQDIAQAIHRTARDPSGASVPELTGRATPLHDDDAELTFIRAGNAGESGDNHAPRRIGYRLEEGTVTLLRWPGLDAAPQSRPARYPVLAGVSAFKLRYLDNAGNWRQQWPEGRSASLLPAGIEIALTLEDSEKIVRFIALP